MKKLAGKRWIRAIAAVLLFLCLAGSAATAVIIQYARSDGWYSMPASGTFADTRSCESYALDGLYFVSSNMRWRSDVTAGYLGSYAGEAFSYVVKDPYGRVTVDTRPENAVYVTEMRFSLSYEYYNSMDADLYTAEGYVNLPVKPYQGCFSEYILFMKLFSLRYVLIAAKVLLLLAGVFCLVILLLGAAKRGREGRLPAAFRQSADAVSAAVLLVLIFRTRICNQVSLWLVETMIQYTGAYTFFYRIAYCVSAGLAEMMLLLDIAFVLWYIAGEIGAGCLYEKLIIRRLPAEAVAVLIPTVNILLGCYMYWGWFYGYVVATPKAALMWLILLNAAVMALLLVYTRQGREICRAARELAAGNLARKTDMKKLHFIWYEIGGDLNSIGDGMTVAVEERLKSERMKTELITNVSHDLKTPLTSIINYIDLLKNNVRDDETREEYIAILERQSAKLKKLTEDVVEASKAASGAISVQTESIDVRELLEQFLGEYSERMMDSGVEPVLSAHCDSAAVMADSALLGRVIENLITNVIKYAMPGTRAYFELSRREGQVVIAVKNVSREPLNNITAPELLERFVRGDSSRHSEGSGLGLSIAQSLTELMGGTLLLVVDGDLFKVELIFDATDPEKDIISEEKEQLAGV